MMLRRTLFALLILSLALPALAQDKTPQHWEHGKFNLRQSMLASPACSDRDVFEGFESMVPPFGWERVVTCADATWEQEGNGWGQEGEYCARVWNHTGPVQDEHLKFDQLVDVAGGEYILTFWAAGSSGQTWDLNSSETVEINGIEMFNFDDEVPFGHHLYYHQYTIDLSDWDGETVTIDFIYRKPGTDHGGAFFLDAVAIDSGAGWQPDLPDPPLNDTCESALANEFYIPSGDFLFEGDNTLASRDYALVWQSCVWYGFTGFDLVWVVCMDAGDNLNVEMRTYPEHEFYDSVFFLVTDCSDPNGSCVAAGDEPELINYTATEDGIYYLICGGWSYGQTGPFIIEGTFTGEGCGGSVAVENRSWSGVKELYR